MVDALDRISTQVKKKCCYIYIYIFCMFLYKVTASLAGLISVTLDAVTS